MSFKEIIKQKKEWEELQKRIKKMPGDYQFVYKEIQAYIFKVAILKEEETNQLFIGIVELLEHGIAEQKEVLDVTGHDVADFCDNLLIGIETYDEYVKSKVEEAYRKSYSKVKK